MPIKPENRKRYLRGEQWDFLRSTVLLRAGNKCEFCNVKNHSYRDGSFIRLAVAHLDQMPENNDLQNLRALCQRCHLRHDAPFRSKNCSITWFFKRHNAKYTVDMFGF